MASRQAAAAAKERISPSDPFSRFSADARSLSLASSISFWRGAAWDSPLLTPPPLLRPCE
jgi:hypothetical protein